MRRMFLVWLVAAFTGCGDSGGSTPDASAPADSDAAAAPDGRGVALHEIQIPAVGSVGIFDPSLAYDPAADRLWMSYSAVNPSAAYPALNPHSVATRLAFSDDGGASWTDRGLLINAPLDVEIALPPPSNAGTWHHEVSALVHDPGAPPGQRWKLIWHHYLLIAGSRRFEHGWFGYRAAASPDGLASAPEVKLLVAGGYDAGNDIENGPSKSPLGGPAVLAAHQLDTDLQACAVASEPTLYATDEALYLAFVCASLSPADRPVALVRCDAPCDATQASSWTYVNTMIDNAAAATLGFEKFSAPELFSTAEGTFLYVTPESAVPFADAYNGCVGFRVSSLDSGQLVTAAGKPEIVFEHDAEPGTFNGACDFDEHATATGILYGHAFPDEPVVFRIFASGLFP